MALVRRRDVGAGIVPQRRGHAHASGALLSPAGLVLRLQRGALLGWGIGMVGFGLILGAMTEQIQDLEGNSREYYESFGGADRIVEAYEASMASMAAMVVAIYVVQIVLRMRAEEAEGTLEPLLAAGVSRSRWVVGNILNAVGARRSPTSRRSRPLISPWPRSWSAWPASPSPPSGPPPSVAAT